MFGIGIPELFIILLLALFFIIGSVLKRIHLNYIMRNSENYKSLELETNKFGGLSEMNRELKRRVSALENQKNEIVAKLRHLDILIANRAEESWKTCK